MLVAALCAWPAWAEATATKRKRDFFGQGALGAYNVPDDAFGTGFVLANRYGWYVHPLIHVGIDFDWIHASEDIAILQGTQRVVSDAALDYFPLLGYVQVESKAGSPYIPYLGAGAGYQLAFVEGANFETEIFDSWGWGCWAGLGVQSRVRGAPTPVAFGFEVFYHSAEVSRMADVPGTGVRTREFISVGGTGARLTFRFRLPEGK